MSEATDQNFITAKPGLTIRCEFCGHEFPDGSPEDTTRATLNHIRVCPDHPIGRELRTLRKLRGLEVKRPDLHQLNDHDRASIGALLQGEGDWWSCHFIRLIARSDAVRRARLHLVFSDHVEAVEKHLGLPNRLPGGVD